MKKKEIITLSCLLVLALVIFLFNKYYFDNSTMVYVKDVDENVLLKFDLNKDDYYEVKGKYGLFHIEVKDGKCRAIDVDCPNQICVHTGWISADDPRVIICLPNGIAVSIDE